MAKRVKEKIHYDKKSDVLWLIIKRGVEEESKEVVPGVVVELGKNGELLGIEIMNASQILGTKFFGKRISDMPSTITTT